MSAMPTVQNLVCVADLPGCPLTRTTKKKYCKEWPDSNLQASSQKTFNLISSIVFFLVCQDAVNYGVILTPLRYKVQNNLFRCNFNLVQMCFYFLMLCLADL